MRRRLGASTARTVIWLGLGASGAACTEGGFAEIFAFPGRVEGSLQVFSPGARGESVERESRPLPRFVPPPWVEQLPAVHASIRSRLPPKPLSGVRRVGLGLEVARSVETQPPMVGVSLPVGGWRQSLAPFPGAERTTASPPPFVLGEALVTLRRPGAEPVDQLSRRPGLSRYDFRVRTYGGPTVAAVAFVDRQRPEREITEEETGWLIGQLDRNEAFVRAEPNYYRRAFADPNDEAYPVQWHYPVINLPAAWDITQGSSDVVVAIIDDGMNPHPDLDRVIAGYDMISDVGIAGDRDGRDNDPRQVPLSHGTSSVWHGTHVGGTVGATSNNGTGAAGVDWQARLLPVRVLGRIVPGRGQGTSVDIIAGINWAVGINVPGVPANPTPADVLNLSLGGGPTLAAEQDAVDDAVERGAVVVVAAGNSNVNGAGQSFAGYRNVIVVGASDYDGRRAPYSNFGRVIDVMAPGGHIGADANADGNPDGVLSTYLNRDGNRAGFQFLEGTSMAAPHVAGVAALMKSVRRSITPAEVEQILRSTANPSFRCNEGCGSGLMNAGAAVIQARGSVDPNQPPRLSLAADRLNLGTGASGSVQVFNRGGGQLRWEASLSGQAGLRIEGLSSGALGAGQGTTLTIVADRAGLPEGEYQGLLTVTASNQEARAAVFFRVGSEPLNDVGGVLVATVRVDDLGNVTVGGAAETGLSLAYRFALDSDPGDWLVLALADQNGNDELDGGDFWGVFRGLDDPVTVTVQSGQIVSGLEFNLVPFVDESEVNPAPCAQYRACIEACAGNPLCIDSCSIEPACQRCFDEQVVACAQTERCSTDDLPCLCRTCEPTLDECFGPLLCAAPPSMPTSADVGEACDSETIVCDAPFSCNDTVPGGYCTRSCLAGEDCGSGLCVGFDDSGDGVFDRALCLAQCLGQGSCPRPEDRCVDVGRTDVGGCLP